MKSEPGEIEFVATLLGMGEFITEHTAGTADGIAIQLIRGAKLAAAKMKSAWIPACAGMTVLVVLVLSPVSSP